MYNRSKIVDENFTKFVNNGQFPDSHLNLNINQTALSGTDIIDLFESQVMSRHLDIQARILKETHDSFYTIGSSGHEGNAVVGKVLDLSDMLFLHYRSAALMIERYKKNNGSTPLYDLLLSFVASEKDPISAGRHKVFGSLPLLVPPQTSTIASHLPKAVGAALSIDRAKLLKLDGVMNYESIAFCNFGDASLNHSTSQGALNTAQWIAYRKIPMPIMFMCEDNGIGISVNTPPGWVENSIKNRPSIKYFKADGLHLIDAYNVVLEAYRYIKKTRMPAFVHFRTVRIKGHAGSDMETEYKNIKDIEAVEFQDPLLHTSRILIENNLLSNSDIISLYENVRTRVQHISNDVVTLPKLDTAEKVIDSIVPNEREELYPIEAKFSTTELFGRAAKTLDKPRNLSQNLNLALFETLNNYKNALIFGEDVAKKGGVYKVTNGLFEKFGGLRVFNTLLDEQAILGTAIGMAHNGFLPIPEIQFLAYYHNAEDQIRGEAATLSFFSNKQFKNPMVLRIAGLAYQKGFGGHFHNDNSIAAIRDLPGVIVACPSNGHTGVKLLRKCVDLAQNENRVVIFLEPIALYMEKDLHEKGDNAFLFPFPKTEMTDFLSVETHGKGKNCAIVTYGNGFYLSLQAQKILKDSHDLDVKIIDIQWLSPLPIEAILKEIKGYSHVLIVDECRETGSLSEELVTKFVENMDKLPKLKRLNGHDTYIPLGTSWKHVLPDKERIVQSVLDLLGKK